MNLTRKIILLSGLLIIPVFIFVFVNNFGKNRYKLPVYFAEDSVMANGGSYKVVSAYTVPDFSLINQDGKSITQKELRGTIYVADFFFTRCPSICPKMTNQLTRVQEEFSDDSSVKIVSFTVDPGHDTAQVLKDYAAMYKANPAKWSFVTGPKDSIYQLAQKGFYLLGSEDKNNPMDFIHSDKLVLVDRSGWIRGYYSGTDQKDVDKLIMEIKVLKEIYANEQSDNK
jgi:protein SCO1/2